MIWECQGFTYEQNLYKARIEKIYGCMILCVHDDDDDDDDDCSNKKHWKVLKFIGLFISNIAHTAH